MTIVRPIDRWFIDEILPHERYLMSVARRLVRDRDEAADLLQDAYCRLLETGGWAASRNPRAYAVQTIRNLAISSMRRARIVDFRQLVEADGLAAADDHPDAFRIVAGREALARAGAALNAMPARCSEVVVRCRVEEQSPRSVATTLGLSLSTLEKRLARGLKLLTAALHPHDSGSAEDAPGAANQMAGRPDKPIAYDRRNVSGAADR